MRSSSRRSIASGGCDGHVFVWDGARKKRVASLRRYPTSVAALAFSPAGDTIAVAASYTYEQGEQAHPKDAIFVRGLADAEVKPKEAKPKAPAKPKAAAKSGGGGGGLKLVWHDALAPKAARGAKAKK